jgi:hypothetical protein
VSGAGIIERITDVDAFGFVAADGSCTLRVSGVGEGNPLSSTLAVFHRANAENACKNPHCSSVRVRHEIT